MFYGGRFLDDVLAVKAFAAHSWALMAYNDEMDDNVFFLAAFFSYEDRVLCLSL